MPAGMAIVSAWAGGGKPRPGERTMGASRRWRGALPPGGIGKGDRVLVHSKNCDEMFWSMFAAFRLGAVWVPTNFRLMPDEVAYLATAAGAKAFLCHGDFPDHAAAVKAASQALAFLWRIGEAAFGEQSVTGAISAHAAADIANTA